MTTLKKIDANIASIKRRGTALRVSIAATALMVMEHAKNHGDTSRALKLVEAIHTASERVKLIQWFNAFSPINVTFTADASKRKVGLLSPDAKKYNAFDLDGAKANPYYNWGKSDDEQTEALTSAETNTSILRLASRFQKRLDAGEVAANDRENVIAKVQALRQAAVAVAA